MHETIWKLTAVLCVKYLTTRQNSSQQYIPSIQTVYTMSNTCERWKYQNSQDY